MSEPQVPRKQEPDRAGRGTGSGSRYRYHNNMRLGITGGDGLKIVTMNGSNAQLPRLLLMVTNPGKPGFT